MESEVIQLSSYVTGVLHTARINAIEVIVSSDKLIKMVNFKLGNEMWRWINQHDMSVGQREILSPRQELNSWPCFQSTPGLVQLHVSF